MNPTIKQIVSQFAGFWKSQSEKSKKRFVKVAIACVGIAIVIAVVMNMIGYVTLYSGLSSTEMGSIATKLSDLGIDYKTRTNGTILVPRGEEAQIQMTLASEGFPQTSLSYDIFSQSSGFMTTDFEKKKYLLFQLQDRLQDAIKSIDGINSAIVTISLPEEDSFVLEEDMVPATASVVLDLGPSVELTEKQIDGIVALVAKSVPGLESSNVAVIDNMGEMINNPYADDTQAANYKKIELEKTISAGIENKVSKLLSPIFGAQNIRIAVNTQVDMSKKVSEQTTYTPVTENGGIVAAQDSSKQEVGGGSSAGGIPGTATNGDVPTYSTVTDSANSGNYSESSSTNYLNNQTVEQTQRDGYEVMDTTVSVLINSQDLTQSQIADYKKMVSYAAGVDAEKVVITKADFISTAGGGDTAMETGLLAYAKNPKYLAAAGGALLVVILGVLVMLKKKRKKRKEDDESFLNDLSGEKPQEVSRANNLPIPEEIVLGATREQNFRKQIKEFSSGSPDIVAQLIRTWIKEDEDND